MTRQEQRELLEHVVNAAQRAGAYLRAHAFDGDAPEWKKADDPVTAHDRAAERLIREHLTQYAPGDFLGEEYGGQERISTRRYIIDPIDGTKQWVLRGFQCSTSIGIEEDGKLVGGVVYDFMRDITYAGYGDETFVQHGKIRLPLHRPHQLSKMRIAVDKNPALRAALPRERFSTLESGGSIALGLAELAAGNHDAMISADIGKGNLWDVAAGAYLCRSQGITMLDAHGAPFDEHEAQRGIVAAKPQTLDVLMPYLERKQFPCVNGCAARP